MEKSSIIFFTVLTLAFLAIVLVLTGVNSTGNVLLNIEQDFNTGEKLTGRLSLTIESGDSIQKDTLILVSLSHNDKIIEVETLTFMEFIEKSDKIIVPVKKDNNYFYEEQGTHTVEINKIIEHTFEEQGSYELFLSILSLDVNAKTKFVVN